MMYEIRSMLSKYMKMKLAFIYCCLIKVFDSPLKSCSARQVYYNVLQMHDATSVVFT